MPEILLHVQIRRFHPVPKMLRVSVRSEFLLILRQMSPTGQALGMSWLKSLQLTGGCLLSRFFFFCLHHPPFLNWHSSRDNKLLLDSSHSLQSSAEDRRPPSIFSAWPYLCLAFATRLCQHSRNMRECHACNPTGRGVSQALTSPDRCVSQVRNFIQGFFMEIIDTEKE